MSRNGRYLFTSESVTEGHPDKIADQISDSILDAISRKTLSAASPAKPSSPPAWRSSPARSRPAAYVDFPKIVRDTIKDIGYTRAKFGFDSETCAVLSSIHGQSPDIAQGVDTGRRRRPGHDVRLRLHRNPELMPMPIMLAHKLVKGLSCARRDGVLDYLRPDGKSRSPIEYDGNQAGSRRHRRRLHAARPIVANDTLREDIIDKIVNRVIPADMMDAKTRVPHQSDGTLRRRRPARRRRRYRPQDHRRHLRRRGAARRRRVLGQRSHEGRSLGVLHGAIRGEEHRRRRPRGTLQVQLAYAIGVAEPVSVLIDTFGTGSDFRRSRSASSCARTSSSRRAASSSRWTFAGRFTRKTAAFGHFGRTEPEFTWERTDKAAALNADAGR